MRGDQDHALLLAGSSALWQSSDRACVRGWVDVVPQHAARGRGAAGVRLGDPAARASDVNRRQRREMGAVHNEHRKKEKEMQDDVGKLRRVRSHRAVHKRREAVPHIPNVGPAPAPGPNRSIRGPWRGADGAAKGHAGGDADGQGHGGEPKRPGVGEAGDRPGRARPPHPQIPNVEACAPARGGGAACAEASAPAGRRERRRLTAP